MKKVDITFYEVTAEELESLCPKRVSVLVYDTLYGTRKTFRTGRSPISRDKRFVYLLAKNPYGEEKQA